MTTRRHDETMQPEASAEGKLHEWVERGKEAVEGHKEQAEELLTEARRYVKKNPAQSLLIAAGLGFLIGALWSRRS